MYKPATFFKKPAPVEMMLYDGSRECADAIVAWANYKAVSLTTRGDAMESAGLVINNRRVEMGFYVIKGGHDDFYPMESSRLYDYYADSFSTEIPKGAGFGIGRAVKLLRDGARVRRSGWNGKGMWLALMPEFTLPPNSSGVKGSKVSDRAAKHLGPDTIMECQPYVVMWTAAQQWQPGWLCSQADLLALDWEVVE